MNKQDSPGTQNCILKVTIDCDGCLERVKKRLKKNKIDGVSYASIDADKGKVVVAGNFDPYKLLKKLKCSWKHVDVSLTGEQKGEGGGQVAAAHSKVVHDFKVPHKERISDDEEKGYGHVHAMPMTRNGAGPRGILGMVGRFLRFVKMSKKEERVIADDTYMNKNNGIKEEKEGNRKLERGGKSKSENGKGNNGNGNMGHMGPMDIRAVQGQYHQTGMQMQMQPPPYNQHQQYMAMMMNQQQHQQQQQQEAYMNNMYPQAMMYGRQHPSMNYMPPPPPMPVHPMNDPITHTFSDENIESCTIM